MERIKSAVSSKLYGILLIFLIAQPLFDVLSFFLQEYGNTSISTMLRLLMLFFIAFLGFVVSDKKRLYVIFYAVVAVFWVCHMANCYRIGYNNMYTDTSNYLRIISLPMYTLSFITFFGKGKDIRKAIYTGFAINFGIIIICTLLPWVTGNPVYTYEFLEVGVMGWFGVRNAQSAIIAIISPLVIYFAYKTEKLWLFMVSVLLTMGLMFLTGTKLTFYSIFLISAGFIFFFGLSLWKKSLPYVLTFLVICVMAVVLRPYSPMQKRERMTDHTQGNYTTLVNESVRSNADETTLNLLRSGGKIEEGSPELLERFRKSLYGVYTDKDVYGRVFADLNERFGVYNVMKAYGYTMEPSNLSDSRLKKTNFAEMMWEEKDLLTRMFGFEYSDMLYGDAIYDLENDFPAIFYFCGYIGFAIYMLFFVYFAFIVLRSFLRDVRGFIRVEIGAVGMTFILAIGAAQISGNVLRRPNVTAYFAIAAAYVYDLCVNNLPEKPASLEVWKNKLLYGTEELPKEVAQKKAKKAKTKAKKIADSAHRKKAANK